MKKDLSEDEKMLRGYTDVLARFLRHYKLYSFEISVTPEERKMIEYHLKDVARHAVKEDHSSDECVALFKGSIGRLMKGDKAEWTQILDLVRTNKDIVTQMTIVTIDDALNFFTKKPKVIK